MELEKYKGRIVAVSSSATSGAWDNWALPERTYYATVVNENNEVVGGIYAGNSDQGFAEVDAPAELMAVYEAHVKVLEEKRRAEQAKRYEEELERERNAPDLGKKMELLKGKNKGFQGVVKWIGENRWGVSVLLVNEKGDKVFTKPHNLKLLAEAPAEPKKGDKVKVLFGKNAGKVGTVAWLGETKYGRKVKVETSEGDVWANPSNLEAA